MKRIVLVALVIVAAPLAAQQRRGKCTGDPVDSTLLASGPVYRDCEVDKVAEARGQAPRPNLSGVGTSPPRTGCYSAEFEFVVGTDGLPEPATIRPKGGNDRAFQEAIGETIGLMRFDPAVRDSQPVRQLVRLTRTMASMVTVERVSAGSPGPTRPTTRPPRC